MHEEWGKTGRKPLTARLPSRAFVVEDCGRSRRESASRRPGAVAGMWRGNKAGRARQRLVLKSLAAMAECSVLIALPRSSHLHRPSTSTAWEHRPSFEMNPWQASSTRPRPTNPTRLCPREILAGLPTIFDLQCRSIYSPAISPHPLMPVSRVPSAAAKLDHWNQQLGTGALQLARASSRQFPASTKYDICIPQVTYEK